MFNKIFGPRLVMPTAFADCLSYGQQVAWLFANKSPVIEAGDGVKIEATENGTIKISISDDILSRIEALENR